VWKVLDAIRLHAPDALKVWLKASKTGKAPRAVRLNTRTYKAKLLALLYADWLFANWMAAGMKGSPMDLHGRERAPGRYSNMPTLHGWCRAQKDRMKSWGMRPLDVSGFRRNVEQRYTRDPAFQRMVAEWLKPGHELLDERMADMLRLLAQVDGEGGEREESDWFIPPA
jgi:hypothetical protein